MQASVSQPKIASWINFCKRELIMHGDDNLLARSLAEDTCESPLAYNSCSDKGCMQPATVLCSKRCLIVLDASIIFNRTSLGAGGIEEVRIRMFL